MIVRFQQLIARYIRFLQALEIFWNSLVRLDSLTLYSIIGLSEYERFFPLGSDSVVTRYLEQCI